MRLGGRKAVVVGASLYAVIIFFGLTFWRLPADKIVPYFAEKFSGGRLLLKAEQSVLSFPLSCRLEKVSYSVKGDSAQAGGRLEDLTLGMDLFGLLRACLPVFFKTTLISGGGIIQGNAGIPFFGTLQKAYLETKATNIDLDKLDILKSLSGRDVKGIADWQMNLQNLADPTAMLGHGNIVVHKGSIDTKLDFAGLKSIPFEIVRVLFKAKDGQLLLEKGEMEGPMLSGTLSGKIRLNKKISSSVLDLTARLKPGPLLEKNPLAGAFLGRIKEGGKEIVMKIGGSAGKPTMMMEH